MITLFTTHCPKCRVLELKLKQKNIPFVENDDINTMLALGIESAPALKVDSQIILFADAVKWVNAQEAHA